MVAVVLTVGRCCLRRCCVRCRRWGQDHSCCAYSSRCCAAHLAARAFFAAAFSSQAPGFVQNGPRMWCSLGGEESVRISSRNLPGVMLSCNEGDAGLAAEVRKKMPHSRPVLNTFEHFVLGFHRGLRPVGLCLRVVPWSRFGASGLISCGLRLEALPGSRIRAQLGFLKKKKERRSISFALMNDERLRL